MSVFSDKPDRPRGAWIKRLDRMGWKPKKVSWVRRLERIGWKLALKHDFLGAKVVKGENEKVSKLYDFWAPVYDFMFRHLDSFKMGGSRLVERVVRPGDRVVDLGTGTGINLEAAFEVTDQVHALDLHFKMLEGAKRWAEKTGRSPHIIQGSATDLPYKDASFDAVISAYMMVYLTPKQSVQCLQECHRVLVDGGRIGVLCGQGEKSPRNPRREEWEAQLTEAGFQDVAFDDFYDVLRIVTARK